MPASASNIIIAPHPKTPLLITLPKVEQMDSLAHQKTTLSPLVSSSLHQFKFPSTHQLGVCFAMAMGGGKQVLVFLGVLLLLLVLLPEAQCGVTYDRKALIINGQRRILISGSIHYARSTPEVTQSHCCLFLFCSTWLRCLVNWLSLSCRCGRDLFRRLRMEDWMLYRLMCSGMGMNPLLEMYLF